MSAPHAETRGRAGAGGTLVLGRQEVGHLLDLPGCIDAVEDAFRRHASGGSIPPAVLGIHVDGGGFHVKTAGMLPGADAGVFVAKVNANFPSNPRRFSLPTIQGVITLFDAVDGRVLAVMDSGAVTSVRTAAATAVAARHLARAGAATVTVCGCGEQARSQLRALNHVLALRRAFAYDIDPERAACYAAEMSAELGIDVVAVAALDQTTRSADVWVTCTPSRRWLVGRETVKQGALVAAVGADHPEKQEIEPELLASSVVVADNLDQCAAMGDLHHAVDAGLMRREDVRAELADVVVGRSVGRVTPDEIIIFDSTGIALEDVAAARLVYERAMAVGAGIRVDLQRPSAGRAQ